MAIATSDTITVGVSSGGMTGILGNILSASVRSGIIVAVSGISTGVAALIDSIAGTIAHIVTEVILAGTARDASGRGAER